MEVSIVFFGSGPVAAASLELLAKDFTIETVITKPKPTHHRGDFPVVELAKRLGLKTVYASTKAELDEVFADAPFRSRLGIVIDYGVIISQAVIDYFPLGIINSHFSLLPEWRGADPISFSILSGQKRTGVSIMLINSRLDEGELLAQAECAIPADYTTPQLTQDLIEISHQCLLHIVPLYMEGSATPAPQSAVTIADNPVPSYSRKLTKDDGILDFTKPALQLEREIRAYAEWPKSRTILAGKDVVITAARVAVTADGTVGVGPGTPLLVNDGKQLAIATSKDLLAIDRLKPAGKAEMTSKAFMAGNRIKF